MNSETGSLIHVFGFVNAGAGIGIRALQFRYSDSGSSIRDSWITTLG